MATFTPPEQDGLQGPEEVGNHPDHDLWRFYHPMFTYHRYVVITGGAALPLAADGPRTFTPEELKGADAGSGDDEKGIFSRKTYTITGGEDTILTAAGYTTVP